MASILSDKPEVELLDGRAYSKVSPKARHASVQGRLMTIIEDLAGDRGFSGTEWRFKIGRADDTNTTFVPDVAYVSFERLRAIPEKQRDEPPFAPDIAVEVRSPSDNLAFLRRKIERYLQTGSVLVLVADPDRRSIAAHDSHGVRDYAAGDRFEHQAVPWLRFNVSSVFARLDSLLDKPVRGSL
ncbi:MAG TPA: Uma2 family endonuclease [Candidatus Rubrimentiphilum sp.]|nr:Uma2 family endonuclease [Candidatus Rubrimentiphilum sp.]